MTEAAGFELDDDGYPTDETLDFIAKARPPGDPMTPWARELLASVKAIWQYSDMGFWKEERDQHAWFDERQITRYLVSTAGWSGNESIIRALQKNIFFWPLYWVQSRRGGHYIFEVNDEK